MWPRAMKVSNSREVSSAFGGGLHRWRSPPQLAVTDQPSVILERLVTERQWDFSELSGGRSRCVLFQDKMLYTADISLPQETNF